MTDEEIIGHVLRGDTGLFAEIVRRHQDSVYGMALRFTGTPSDAEDVSQEAFLKAFRSLPGFKGEARVSTWLFRIVYNLCIDWLRKKGRSGSRAIPLEEGREIPDSRSSVEGDVLSSEDKERVRVALNGLEERYRSVVILLYYQDMSYVEISEVLNIPVKTVETRLYRARRMLRERLERA
jgi:RNA polymerase sigma-70 factor (ECF subfamily)